MTPEDKLAAHKHAWEKQILSVVGTGTQASTIVEIAGLNGLFDAAKALYAAQERLGPEFEKVLYDNLPGLYAR